ncbi:MAG TPA: lipoyl(octanoyl) transferase LipB [Acidobacteriaceae bacterium]|nr:lipoyl(octanoyl) transferase LipB [Acidobacteriaceae bacterium]
MHLHLLQLGRIPYTEGLRIQDEVVAARKASLIGDTLLLMEHPPVLTLGRNATRANIVATDDLLARKGVEIHETNRGGEVTYHGPGQLVGYPIFDLRGDPAGLPGKRGAFLGPVDFVRLMEEALIHTCKDFGVPAQRICKRTGVWTYAGGSIPEKKIAAIGIHVSNAITSHGFALNVTTDLRDFGWIIPCGIADRGVTSLELESPRTPPPTLQQAADRAAANFGRIFNRQVLAADSLEAMLSLIA